MLVGYPTFKGEAVSQIPNPRSLVTVGSLAFHFSSMEDYYEQDISVFGSVGGTGRTTMGHWRRWGRSKRARIPTVFMTWLGMSGNGSATGMTMPITKTARRGTRQDQHRANQKRCGVARGIAVQRICDLHSGTSTGQRTGTRIMDFAAR